MDDPRKTDRVEARKALETAYRDAGSIFQSAVLMARYLWNLEMRGLKTVGLMPIFVRAPWLFFALGLLLLAFLTPLGAFFVVTAVAAASSGDGPKAANEFQVRVRDERPKP